MNKYFIKILGLFILIILLEGFFFIQPVEAKEDLILEKNNVCDIQYGSDNCIISLNLINNTSKVLKGDAFLYINYTNANHIDENVCKSGSFDGEGIIAQFSTSSIGNNWLNFSNIWKGGTTTVSDFNILKGKSHPRLKLKTSVNLCPGNYNFKLVVQGTSPTGKVYRGVVAGGQGGGFLHPLIPPAAAATKPTINNTGKKIQPGPNQGIVEGASSTRSELSAGKSTSSSTTVVSSNSSTEKKLNWNSMLLASLSDSLGNFLKGKLAHNLFFWILIGSLGFLLYLISIIRKPSILFKILGFAGIWFMFISFFLLPLPVVNQFRISWPKFISYPIGILFIVAGIIAIVQSLRKISPKVAFGIKEPARLAISGIYGTVRHPLYLGFIILSLGLCFMFGSVLAFIFLPLVVLFLWILSFFEEKELLGIYGEIYQNYKLQVKWRLIPKIL